MKGILKITLLLASVCSISNSCLYATTTPQIQASVYFDGAIAGNPLVDPYALGPNPSLSQQVATLGSTIASGVNQKMTMLSQCMSKFITQAKSGIAYCDTASDKAIDASIDGLTWVKGNKKAALLGATALVVACGYLYMKYKARQNRLDAHGKKQASALLLASAALALRS